MAGIRRQAIVPEGCLLVEQHYDRRSGVYFYDIVGPGRVISSRQSTDARLLAPGEATDVIITRGRQRVARTIVNRRGRPAFFTRRGRRDWWEELRWRF